MGNLSHTVGGTDNLVSFKSAARVPIDSLKVHFSPIQEGEGDPSPENVRPIRGWNEVEAYRSGKNVAQVVGYNAKNTANADAHDALSNNYGTTISTNNYSLPDTSLVITQTQAPNVNNSRNYQNGYFAIMVKNLIYDQYYDVSFKITDITNNILNYDINGIVLMTPNGTAFYVSEINGNTLIFKNVQWKRNTSQPDQINRSNFEIRNCGMSFTLSEFMVTPVGMNDGVFEPYCGEVIPVTFPAEVGTIYGGYVDLVNGEFVAEYGHYTFSGSEEDSITYYDTSSTLGNVERHRFRTKILDRLPINYSSDLAYTNIAKPISTQSGDFLFYIGSPTNQILFYIKSSMCEPTVESFNAWLSEHPLQLVYKLKDPVHYPLTATQLQTFIGNNAFWSNTNDVTEVSYAIHDTAPIRAARKRIMAASPHIETASGGLVNFNTDVAAPLKECKIYFEPVQEGEGDPSPENIRPIKGWNNIEVTNGTTIQIIFPAEAGTIYGGYVDLIKGKLIQEWIQVKINSLSWTYMNSGECFRSQVPMERRRYKEISPVRSSIYETLEVGQTISSWTNRKDYSISEHIGNSGDTLIQSIHIKDSRYTTVSDFLNGVGNENIVYKLLTPIEYFLAPETLKTLRGVNNIWSTSNGPISIKYWKH